MSTLFTIASGNLTDNIFARTISDADITSVSAVMGIGTTPVDITNFLSDGSSIWGVSFNVKSRADNPTGLFSCKLFDSFNVEQGTLIVPISNFPSGDGSNNIDSVMSQSWQTLKFDAPIATSGSYYIRLSANTDGELYFYGLPQLDETIVDFASNSDITPSGNVSQGSFNPFSTKTWSAFFNNSANILCPTNDSLNLSTKNFTIDFWCYLVEVRNHRLASFANLNIDVSTSNTLVISGVDTTLPLQENVWVHIAVTRTGNVLNGYVDGIKSSDITIANNYNFSQGNLVIGKDRSVATPYMHGHIYNFRVVLNQALYSANFSKPTSATSKLDNGGATPSTLPADGNVKFLILDRKNYLDGVNTQLVNGTLTKSVKNSPYNTYSTYLELISRSDGVGYIEIPITMIGRTTWTIDGFFYPRSNGGNNYAHFCDARVSNDNSLIIYNPQNTSLNFRLGSTLKTTPFNPNTWNHIAVVYTNGVGDLYLNGTKTLSITSSTPINANHIRLLNNYINSNTTAAGSISHFRISDNARYTADFSPPSRSIPPKKDANTIFLLGRKNSHIMADKMGNWEVQAPFLPVRLLGNVKGGVAEFTGGDNIWPGSMLYVPGLTWNMNSDWTVMVEFSLHSDSFPIPSTGRTIFRVQDADPNNNVNATMSFKIEPSGLVFYYSYTGGMPYNSLSASIDAPVAPSYRTFAAVYTASTNTLDLYYGGTKVNSKVLTGPLFTPTTGGLSLFGSSNQTNYCVGYLSNFVVTQKAITNPTFANNYYFKDAVIWLDFNGRSSSDFTNIYMQTIGDISDSDITVGGDFFMSSAGMTYSSVTPIVSDVLPDNKCLAMGPNKGNYPNVTLDYIDKPYSSSYYIDNSSDFTVESWVQSNTATNQGILNIFDGGLSFGLSAGKPFIGKTNGPVLLSSISAVNQNDNLWHHLAVSRSSGNLSLFVDGRLSASTTDTTEFSAGKLRLFGDFSDSVNIFDGYIADLRLTKGQALYTTTFTPPTATITTTNNGGATPSVTPIATNVIVLEADNPATDPTSIVTYPTFANNGVLTQAPSAEFNPFIPEETYNPTTHGGSIYFDGTGDLISVSERSTEFTFGTSDFNVEFWYYPTDPTLANEAPLLTWQDNTTLADGIFIKFTSNTNLQALLGNNNTEEVTLNADGTYSNQWSHIALSRKGSVYRLFVNGNLRRSASYTGLNLSNDNDKLKIGENCKGYISDVRVIKGQAIYIDDFTPSNNSLTLTNKGATGPGSVELTTTPNLLIKGIKSGIYDGSANNNILQEGNIFSVNLADTINADANYTDNALVFNGVFNNNYLVLPPSPALNLVGDFWIDFWMNSSKWKRDTISRRILTLGSVSSVSAFHVCINATGTDKKLQILSNTNIISSNFDYADGLWHHVGIGRNGSTLSLYKDGVLDASATNTTDYNSGVSNNSYIGIYGDSTVNKGRYGGKLVGLRIINGECVHTSNYAVPTEPATLTSDGGNGINKLGNVSLFMKLNNIVSPVNSHVIVAETQSITGIIKNPETGVLTTYTNITSSSDIPTVTQGAPAGTRSISFSSIGSWIDVPTSHFQMKGDWTIEGYFKPLTGTNDGGAERMIISFNSGSCYLGYLSGAYYLQHPSFTTRLSAAGAVSTWCHVAACKKANEISLYVNGARTAASTATVDSQTVGDVFTAHPVVTLGIMHNASIGKYFGYMYRPRIIDGRALYNGNFTSNTVAKASALSATADTVFLYVDATTDVYYKPGNLEKIVIGGSISNDNVITPITITTSLSDWALNNVSIQNYGTFTSPATSNSTFNITNNGLKIGSGGTFILSAAPGYRKVLNLDESRIHVAGGTLDIRGQQKTIKATLTGSHPATRNIFTLNETPTNWLSGDSLVFLPPSANRAQFEELSVRSVITNRLSTTTNSLYEHQYLVGIPSIANASRNFAIKGLSTNRRGWLQFDKTSNTYICDTEFEHLGRSTSKKVGSIVLNVKSEGSFLLSGCYLDGSTSSGVDATTLYGRSYNVTFRDNVFYKYAGNTFAFNNIADNFNINDNLILRSGLNGIKLQNATLGGTCNLSNNISLGNTERGTYIENVDGNIEGSANWYNTTGGLYLAKPATGENKDLTDDDIEITETATTNLVSFDTPISNQYPDETSTYPFNRRLIWPSNPKYVFFEDFTIEAFLKFSVNNTNEFNLLGNTDTNELGAIMLTYQSNTQTFRLKTFETSYTTKGTAALSYIPINTWHHIAICRKDDLISVYFNGNRIISYTSSFEFKASGGITLGWGTDATNKGVYGLRILNRAEYDSLDTITVPTAPFVVDNETLLLYKRTIKTGATRINNILNNNNGVGGMFIDNSSPSLKKTTISNISCIKNDGYGLSIDGTNLDYREANSLTATNIVVQNNNAVGLNLNNMTGVLTGVLATDNATTNIQLKLGDGITKVKSVTGLVISNVPNMIIYSSKSFRPVIFDDIYLNKNNTMTPAYSAVPLHIRNTDFLNFHFDNSTLAAVSTGFAVTLSGSVLGTYQFSNTVTTNAGVQNLSCLPPDNIKSGGIIFMNKNGNKGSHESFYRKGKRATDTSVIAGNIAEKITPSSLTDWFKSGSKFVAVSTNDTVKLRMKVTTTVNGDARLMLKKNSSLGFNEDVLLYPISNSSTFTTTSPSASGVGIMEFFVDCTGTTGSVIIDDWKAK